MSIEKGLFGTAPCGRAVENIILKNANGTELEVISYGCRVRRLKTRDRNGNLADVVLGFDTLAEYMEKVNYQGAVVGRFANRIGNAEFTLDGKSYPLSKNDGRNTLHGGPNGFWNVIWDLENTADGDEPSVTFAYLSKDMEEGYPGNLKVRMTYTLTADDTVKLAYEAECDKRTPFNMTNHSYFNLSGDLSSDICDHVLALDVCGYTDGSDDLIPNGKLLPVEGSPLDFREGKPIGQDIACGDPTIVNCKGFDHTFALCGEGFRKVGCLYCPRSGRGMEVYTDLPSIQLYTDNDPGDIVYKGGIKKIPHQSVCLETQMFPDSPNLPVFPSSILEPGKKYKTVTAYKFFVQ